MKSIIFRLVSLSLSLMITMGRPAIAEETQPPQQPQQQPQDRKDGAGAAQALAIVGAAMAGLGCAELLRQAAQTQDPSEKAQLRAMAMQQCAQAAQSAANAAKNGEGKQQMSSNNTPTGSQLDNNNKTAEPPKEQKNEMPQLPSFANNERVPETPSEVADTNNTQPVQPHTFDQAPATADEYHYPSENYSAVANSISTLQPIPKASVQYDEGNKNQTAADTRNPNPVTSSAFSNSGLSAEALRKLAEQKAESEADKKKKKNNSTESGEGSSGEHGHDSASSGSASGAGGNAAGAAEDQGFSAMLSSLLNPGAGAPAGLAAGNGGAFATGYGGEEGKSRAPNIFEYASYRYRKLSHETLVGKRSPVRMTASIKERN